MRITDSHFKIRGSHEFLDQASLTKTMHTNLSETKELADDKSAYVELQVPVPLLTTKEQVAVYAKNKNGQRFSNKADFHAFQRLVQVTDICSSAPPFLIGGVNEGQYTAEILNMCPEINVRGFEIQKEVFSRVIKRFKAFPGTRFYNLGWGEKLQTGLSIGGLCGHAGLYDLGELPMKR